MSHPCPYCRGRGTAELGDPSDFRAVRLALGIAVKEAAARLGVTSGAVSNFEHGSIGRSLGPAQREQYAAILSDAMTDRAA